MLAASAHMVARHWQLLLLGLTSLALSIASGWTTWDGMTNFTDKALLSFLLTFGIQGVMLVSAWMIGETFVKSADEVPPSAPSSRRAGFVVESARSIVALSCVIVIGAGTIWFLGLLPLEASSWHFDFFIAVATLVAGVLLFRNVPYASGIREIVQSYIGSAKTILRNIPLWIMFLACMAASVFFSFDSLFDNIFSPKDRERASQSRMQIEVAGLLSDLSGELEKNRRNAVMSLFDGPQWHAYEEQIRALELEALKVPSLFQAIRQTNTDIRDEEIASELEAVSVAQANLAALEERISLAAEALAETDMALRRVKSMARSLDETLLSRRAELQRKRAEAKAEAIGIGVTKKAGKGPQYRQIKKEEDELRIATELLAEQLSDVQVRIARLVEERASKAAHAAKLKSEAAKLTGRIELAHGRLATLRAQRDETLVSSQGIAAKLDALNEAKRNFVNTPDKENFAKLQHQCEGLVGSLKRVPGDFADPDHVDCTADFASEATGRIFAANAVSGRFNQACGKAIKVDGRSTNELLSLGQQCLQISGLQMAAILPLRTSLREASLRRDDRAHRFIVTWNAFFDRNLLAFVALFIALAIDGLVFISGLLGASARAQLSTSGTGATLRDRQGREVILDAALLPHAQEGARVALKAVSYSKSLEPGILAYVDVSEANDSDGEILRSVLNAACAIDLASKKGPGQTYAIKPELIEYLSRRLDVQRIAGSAALVESNPEELLRVSLRVQSQRTAQLLLEASRPVQAENGFTHEIDTKGCPADVRHLITGVLNAGVASGFVLGDPNEDGRYLVSAAFFSLIARLAAQDETINPPAKAPATSLIRARRNPAARKEAGRSPHGQVQKKDKSSAGSVDEQVRHTPQERSGPPPADPAAMPPSPVTPESCPGTAADQFADKRTDWESLKPSLMQTRKYASEHATLASHLQTCEPSGEASKPSETRKPNGPTMPTTEKTAAERQATSQVIVFSDESKIRSGGARTTEEKEVSPAQSANELRYDEAFSALRQLTGLTTEDLTQLCGPQEKARHHDARAALDALRAQDNLFDKQIAQLEKKFRREWEEVSSAFDDPLAGQSQSATKVQSIPAIRLLDENYALVFMRARVLREARSWFAETLSRLELAADANAISASEIESLREIAKHLRSFMPIDRQHVSDWNDLICRIESLCEGQERNAAFGDIMP